MSRPWMALWIADYLKHTGHLNAAESGAYLHLIMHYWTAGCLPDDDGRLARIAKMTPDEWQEARSTIRAFFKDDWRHKRIDHELAEAERLSAAGKAAGLASAEAKKSSGALRQKRYRDRKTLRRVTPSVTPDQRHFHQQIQDDRTERQRSGNGSSTIGQPSPSPSPSNIKKETRYASRDAQGNDPSVLKEGKQAANGPVRIELDTPQWRAWQDHLRKTTGKGTPHDRDFGWIFPSLWPPGHPGAP